MFGNNDELIKLLKEIRDNETARWEQVQQWHEEDQARYLQWREEDKQAAAERLERQLEQQQESDKLARELVKANAEQAHIYAQERDAEQTRIMQDTLATFQEKLAIEKALIQAAQPIDKQAIHNEVERDRKAAARANKKNKSEETTANDAV